MASTKDNQDWASLDFNVANCQMFSGVRTTTSYFVNFYVTMGYCKNNVKVICALQELNSFNHTIIKKFTNLIVSTVSLGELTLSLNSLTWVCKLCITWFLTQVGHVKRLKTGQITYIYTWLLWFVVWCADRLNWDSRLVGVNWRCSGNKVSVHPHIISY